MLTRICTVLVLMGLVLGLGVQANADTTSTLPLMQTHCPVTGAKLGSMGKPVEVKYKDHTVKFCCQPCIAKFKQSPESYMSKLAGVIPVNQSPATQPAPKVKPYTLETCVVTGAKLGSMGKPVVLVHGDQEMKFCCQPCIANFKKNPEKYLAKVKAAAKPVAKTKPYTLNTCIVTDQKLGSMGKPVVLVHEDQEIKFCCQPCVVRFNANPKQYMAKLNAKMKPAMELKTPKLTGEAYPLEVCIVRNQEKLGGKGRAFVHEGQIIKVCCKMCERRFKKNPAKYMKIMEALASSDTDAINEAGSKSHDHSGHDHGGHHH